MKKTFRRNIRLKIFNYIKIYFIIICVFTLKKSIVTLCFVIIRLLFEIRLEAGKLASSLSVVFPN